MFFGLFKNKEKAVKIEKPKIIPEKYYVLVISKSGSRYTFDNFTKSNAKGLIEKIKRCKRKIFEFNNGFIKCSQIVSVEFHKLNSIIFKI